jgi:hypothetical protein
MKQDTKRFVVPPGLTNEGQIRGALQLIVYINEQNGKPSDVVLFIPTKSQLDGTIIDATLGERVCRALKKGEGVSLSDGSFLTCETKRTFKNYMPTEVVLCVFPDKDMLKALDSIRSLKVAVVVPWHMEEVSEWIRAWNPIILGKEHGEAERLIAKPVVEEAMVMLTRYINTSTGLTHPSDKGRVIELLKILRDNGELYDPASLRAWALRHGWTPEGAEDLEKYAQAVLNRRSVRGDKHAWSPDIIEILRQRASEKSEDDS